jgi:hypothetical protein
VNQYCFVIYRFAVDKESDRVEWVKALQECVEKSVSNERMVQMANIEQVISPQYFQFVIFCDIHSPQTRKTDQLLQKHLFQQDAFAERFQTKYDQESITSEVLNQRCVHASHVTRTV